MEGIALTKSVAGWSIVENEIEYFLVSNPFEIPWLQCLSGKIFWAGAHCIHLAEMFELTYDELAKAISILGVKYCVLSIFGSLSSGPA